MRSRLRSLAAAAALLPAACYRYAPVAPADLHPGQEVRAELGDQGTADLARWLGPRSAAVQGRVQAVSDTALMLSVTEVVRRNGVTEPWQGEAVTVPRAVVASFGERRFDRTRTALVGLGAVALMVGVDAMLGDAGVLFRGRGRGGGGQRQ